MEKLGVLLAVVTVVLFSGCNYFVEHPKALEELEEDVLETGQDFLKNLEDDKKTPAQKKPPKPKQTNVSNKK